MRIKVIISVLFFIMVSASAFAYSNGTTHPAITQSAVDKYQINILSESDKNQLRAGSYEEDLPNLENTHTLPDNLWRAYNHFLDPKTNLGFSFGYGTGWPNAREFAYYSRTQLDWAASIGRSNDQSDLRDYFKDYSYQRAVYLYNHENNYVGAFRALGHVAHLLQDMGSPPHVWNDAHVLGALWGGWAISNALLPNIPIGWEYEYEYYVSDKKQSVMSSYTGDLIQEVDPKVLFTRFSEETRKDFFSEDHTEPTEEWKNDHQDARIKVINSRKYLVGSLKSENVPSNYVEKDDFKFARNGLFTRWTPNDYKPLHYILDTDVYDGYWDVLSYKATLYTASLINIFQNDVALPTVEFSIFPTNIEQGQCSVLSWSSSNADTITIDQGIGEVATTGTKSICPSANTVYTITASGHGSTDTKSVLLSVTGSPPSSQSWMKTFGGPQGDIGFSVEKTKDGGYIITGQKGWSTPSVGAGTYVYLIKTDGAGNTIWEKTYARTWDEAGYSVQQTTDGGYIIAGKTTVGSGGAALYVIKTDNSGNVAWETAYGGIVGKSVRQTSDAGYIILANHVLSGYLHLIKVDINGTVLWDKIYGLNSGGSVGSSVELTSDDGYIVTGSINIGIDPQIYLLKTDVNGDIIWEKTFGEAFMDYGRSAQQTLDGGYIITGKVFSFIRNGYYLFLKKLDANGNPIWENTYGPDDSQEIRQTAEGGYIVVGSSGGLDCYLMKTDIAGNFLWENTFGGSLNDQCYSVRQANDGGYVFVGYTDSYGAGYSDVYLVKTDENGNTGKWSATAYMDTGQTICYDGSGNAISCAGTGQDGEYNINPMIFTDNGDGTVTNKNTGLIWQKQDDGNTYNWYQASGTYDVLYNLTSKSVCGELGAGWRLPAKKELMSIVDYGVPSPGPVISTIFPNTKPSNYWSSLRSIINPNVAWYVDFSGGEVRIGGYGVWDAMYVRCVRGEQIPTAPTALQDNGNGTVTDHLTGLVWQQGEPGGKTWPEALSYCETLPLGDNTDWRLPNIKELASLIDDTRNDVGIDPTKFPNATANYYWSSTSNAFYPGFPPGYAWYAWFGGNDIRNNDKSYPFLVRCVRGGR